METTVTQLAQAHDLQKQGRLFEAIACLVSLIEQQPETTAAYFGVAAILREMGRFDEAVDYAEMGVSVGSETAETLTIYGSMLHAAWRLDEAIDACRRAIAFDPNFAYAHSNLATILRAEGRLDEALEYYDIAVRLKPDDAHIRYYRSMALLARGDFSEGWAQHEWRWKGGNKNLFYRGFGVPQWTGQPAAGKTLLIHAEQGSGDTLQFCRYATLAAAKGLRVILAVPKPLGRLLNSLAGPAMVVALSGGLPSFDLQCPMMSLPLAFRTTLETIPVYDAYLHPNEDQSAAWRLRLAELCGDGLRVGLVWAGLRRSHIPDMAAIDRRRSMPLERLAPLLSVPGVHFFSLQKIGRKPPPDYRLHDFMDEMRDFADTAALVANLDLVISVDTAMVHLAGALGKPVWLLDRFDSCWRWLTDRRDSPWYPTLRIYRQPKHGDWDTVVSACAADLTQHLRDS